MSTQLDPLSISGDLLYAVETEGETAALRDRLATFDSARLERTLTDRRQRLAFWLNCYNAYTQLLLEEERSLLESGLISRWKFFAQDRIPVAGVWLSLNDIEHGMLRSSKHGWGMGYLPRLFPSSFERRFRLESVDPRVHFALNWGSENCPPITVYSGFDVDAELEIATEWYLEENVTYDPRRAVVTLPRLFLWYRGDFGGKHGIYRFLEEYDVIPAGTSPSLRYHAYDWSSPDDTF